jgi:DNA-repair protein XRCC2
LLDGLLLDVHPRSSALSSLNRGDVVELQGPPCSGKTEILVYWILVAALPAQWQVDLSAPSSSRPPRAETLTIGGRGQAVAFFDNDGRFSAQRVEYLMRNHIEGRLEDLTNRQAMLFGCRPTPAALQQVLDDALARIHVFRPASTLSLAATLRALPRYLHDRDPDTELAYVMIDSLSAFHHQDAFRHREVNPENLSHPLKHVLVALADLRRTLSPVIVLTTWALSTADAGRGLYRQHLSAPYPSPFADDAPAERAFAPDDPLAPSHALPLALTHHITLHLPTPAVPPFPLGTTLDEAGTGEAGRTREEARRQAATIGVVRLPGVMDDPADEAGRFALRLTSLGVDTSGLQGVFTW